MGTQNFEGFKPLSENEEKQITGGGGNTGNQACQQIAQQIQNIDQKIQAMQQQTGQVPPMLYQELQQAQAQYQVCMQQNSANG